MNRIYIVAYGFILLALIMPPVHSADWPECKFQCQAKDVTVSRIWIGDSQGNDLQSAEHGQEQPCYLWATIDNNANALRYAVIILADLYINGTLTESFYDRGICVLDEIRAKSSTNYPLIGLTWRSGEEIRLKRFVLSWETAKGTSCSKANRKCSNRNTKCYGGEDMEFLVQMPITPFFSWDAQNCTRSAKFFDGTAGGMGSYDYYWDFGDGTTSQETNPVHAYGRPGSYEVRLRINDQSGKTASISRQIVLGICPCTIVGEEHACQEDTQTYRVVMNDSVSGQVQWYLDGTKIESAESKEIDEVNIEWIDYEVGEHYLQAILLDENEGYGQMPLRECNLSIAVIAKPLATITFGSAR
jgi:hypothetical protein